MTSLVLLMLLVIKTQNLYYFDFLHILTFRQSVKSFSRVSGRLLLFIPTSIILVLSIAVPSGQ